METKQATAKTWQDLVNLLINNKQHLEEVNYLSFEEVCSIMLSDAELLQGKFKWIDGVQLSEDCTEVVIWVSSENSVDIDSLCQNDIPATLIDSIYTRAEQAIDWYKANPA